MPKNSTPNRTFPILLALLLSPFIIIYLFCWLIYSAILYLGVMLLWLPHAKDVLFVYSNSPNWEEYVKVRILPKIQERAIVLNWSERSQWKKWSLAAACFRHFGAEQEFNPMAVVFRRFRRAKVFRFWQAFRDYKHGKAGTLQEVERSMFEYIGLTR